MEHKCVMSPKKRKIFMTAGSVQKYGADRGGGRVDPGKQASRALVRLYVGKTLTVAFYF
jgi:hypothetical protein